MDTNNVYQRSTFVRSGRRGRVVLPEQHSATWKEESYLDLFKSYLFRFYSKQIYSGTFQATLLDSTTTELKKGWVMTGYTTCVDAAVTELLDTPRNGSTKVARSSQKTATVYTCFLLDWNLSDLLFRFATDFEPVWLPDSSNIVIFCEEISQ